MGRQFGLIAVLTLMVLVIEFTPGCHGRTLSSKHHSHHHHHEPSGDSPPPPPQEGSGESGNYPPPSQDGNGASGDFYPPPSQDDNSGSDDRHYGQPPQGGSGGSGNHPHPPPQGGSGASGDFYPPTSEDDNSGSDDRQFGHPPQGGSGGSGNHPHPPPQGGSGGSGSHHHPPTQGGSGGSGVNPASIPDWSDFFGDVSSILDEEGVDNENSVDLEDAADTAASQLASLRSRLVASLEKELMRNSRQGRPHANDADAIKQLAIQIAKQIGLVDKDGKIHWEVLLTLKEEQIDAVSKIVSEFINQHFVDEQGNIKWNDIAQALFGNGGVISGDHTSAGTTAAPQSRSLSRLLSLIQMQRF